MNYEPEIDTIIELLSWDYVLPDPIEEVMQKDLARVMNDCLDSLTPREAKVLRLHFGLDRDRDYTFEQIGEILGVTRERVRQIEAKALRKMRSPVRSQRLWQAHPNCDTVKSEKELKEYERTAFKTNTCWDKPVDLDPKPKPPPREWEREWVRRWDREDPDEMVHVKTTQNGWINGSKYHPMIAGIYVRRSNGFQAFSKWTGKSWLQGSKNIHVAATITENKVSGHQLIEWRKVKHNEQL